MTTVQAEIDLRDNWYFYGMRSQLISLKVLPKSKTTSKLLIREEAARLTSYYRQHGRIEGVSLCVTRRFRVCVHHVSFKGSVVENIRPFLV